MLSHFSHLPWLAILVGGLAFMVLGGIWFAVLFGKQYAVALGRENAPSPKPSLIVILGPLLCCMAISLTNAVVIQACAVTTYADALGLGAIIGIGYLGAMTVMIAINPNFPRPLYYSLINGPYFVLGNLLDCLILMALR